MSVDSAIWPSIFSSHLHGETELDGSIVVERAEPVDNCGDALWTDLEQMKAHAAAQRGNGLVVAIEIFVPPDADVDEVPSNRLFLTFNPPILPPQFHLLGFDIAGVSCFSGMSNCGYDDSERSELLPFWSSRINEHGLITTYDDAVVFRQITEERTGEHGPFFVFALYGET